MNRILIVFFVLLPALGFSQTYINKSRARVKQELEQYRLKNDNLTITILEAGGTIRLSVLGGNLPPARFIYSFDKTGKCNSEKAILLCDSCTNEYLKATLNQKQIRWRKINENQYVSEFSKRLMLELPLDSSDHSYTILRMNWSQKMYDMLLQKQNAY